MKDIGILTYHSCLNYGACLQAYALLNTIKKYDKDAEIINYQSEKLRNISDVFPKVDHPKEAVKLITRIPYYKSLKNRQKNFNNFFNNILDVSSLYKTEEEVKNHAQDYRCIVCGSDQIWNLDPKIRYENPVYYLNFEKKQRRVAYAASFGDWVNDADKSQIEFLPWVKKFDMISIREKSGKDYLESKGIKCVQAIDPVFLLTREEYDQILKEPYLKEKYVLLFSWNGSKNTVKISKKIAEKLNVKVYNIIPPPRAMFRLASKKLDAGPREFLGLIKNAEFIVTNSFHGTAFSIIYKKPFVSVASDKNETRRQSLLESLGLLDHLVSDENFDMNRIYNTDYDEVYKKIEVIKNESLEYLKKAISLKEE